MSVVKCAEDSNRHAATVCLSPITCLMRRACAQVRTAVRITKGTDEQSNGVAKTELDTWETDGGSAGGVSGCDSSTL